jgi:hypothetical protein
MEHTAYCVQVTLNGQLHPLCRSSRESRAPTRMHATASPPPISRRASAQPPAKKRKPSLEAVSTTLGGTPGDAISPAASAGNDCFFSLPAVVDLNSSIPRSLPPFLPPSLSLISPCHPYPASPPPLNHPPNALHHQAPRRKRVGGRAPSRPSLAQAVERKAGRGLEPTGRLVGVTLSTAEAVLAGTRSRA